MILYKLSKLGGSLHQMPLYLQDMSLIRLLISITRRLAGSNEIQIKWSHGHYENLVLSFGDCFYPRTCNDVLKLVLTKTNYQGLLERHDVSIRISNASQSVIMQYIF